MLQTILLVVHVLVALALIAIILLQQGRGATAGAAFGSGASGTVFGARGSATFLSRATSILALLFFGNCLLLAWLASDQGTPRSLGDEIAAQAEAAAKLSDTLQRETAPGTASSTAPESPAVPAAAADAGLVVTPETKSPAVTAPADMPLIPPASDKP